MSTLLDKFSLKQKLQLLVGIAILVIVVILGIVMGKTSTVRIGGDTFYEIVNGKDLVADILPPPMFVVDAQSTAQSILVEKSQKARKKHLKDLERLKDEFQERVDYWESYPHLPGNVRSQLFKKVIPTAEEYFDYAFDNLPDAVNSGDDVVLKAHLAHLLELFEEHYSEVVELVKLANGWSDGSYKAGLSSGASMDVLLLILVVVGVFSVSLVGWGVIRNVTRDEELAARIQSALDAATTNIMIADKDNNIVYLNDSVRDMFKAVEDDLSKAFNGFNADDLLGKNMDIFHKDPSHQKRIIGTMTDTVKGKAEVAGLTFTVIATPILNEKNERIGSVVEWDDVTEKLAREKEEKRISAENLRIRQALDNVTANVMIADNDNNIIYLNDSVHGMFKSAEADLKTVFSDFNADELVGKNMDIFHKDPSHQKKLVGEMKDTVRGKAEVAGRTFTVIANPIIEDSGERIGSVVEWDDITEKLAKEKEEKRIAGENYRIRQALDNVSANVMIADEDCNIIYMNDSITGMFRAAESDLRTVFSGFNANDLIGKNMDIFHKDVSHQRNLVENMTSTVEGKAEVAGRTFTVIANPIVTDGERIGSVVEWNDRTAEVAIEKEIDSIVDGAAQGDFSRLIPLEGKADFFLNLSTGLNRLVETVQVAVNDVVRVMGSMAKGDLTESITRDYDGAFGQLKSDVNSTVTQLTEVIGNIRASATAITSAAGEIAQGNADLSQRTEEQASSLEETASSMEEMTSAVRQSATNAKRASDLASDAQEKAREGGEVVGRAVTAMADINESSKKISDIIGVIDEIAFQTNLLALNAAVEAARAGEQGRGFAVVAGEVRNLAQRSAGAAKEIKDLIRDSVNKVSDGSELVNESGNTLQDIVNSVEQATNMMSDINTAAQEQTSGIEQVNTAVSQMDEMTQQNAALVEEASAAGEAMAEQARNMSSMMDFFTVDDSGRSTGLIAPVTASPATSTSSPVMSAPARAPAPSAHDDDDWEEF